MGVQREVIDDKDLDLQQQRTFKNDRGSGGESTGFSKPVHAPRPANRAAGGWQSKDAQRNIGPL